MSPPKFSAKFKSRYLVKGPLGQGGMAEVFLAFDKELMRDVAVKVLSPLSTTGNSRKRFDQEGRFTASLQHPHIVTLHGFGEDDDRAYLVFEYVQGKSLRDLLKLRKRIDLERSLTLIRQMAEGLHHAHDLQIIHRDLKPENILITEAGEAKIADFGLAKVSTMTNALTQEGMVLGTPGYLAPEVIQGEQATPTSDLYSLTIVLYEMLHGQLPFSGATEREMLVNYIRLPAPTLLDLGYEVPRPLSDFVSRALSRKPEKRFPSGAVYLSELRLVEEAVRSWASADPLRLTEAIRLRAAEPAEDEEEEEGNTRPLTEAEKAGPGAAVTEKRTAMKRQDSGRTRNDPNVTKIKTRTTAGTTTPATPPWIIAAGSGILIFALLAGGFWLGAGSDKERPLEVSEKFRLVDGPRVVVGATSAHLTWTTNEPTWTHAMLGPAGGGGEKLVMPPVLPHQGQDEHPVSAEHKLTVRDLDPGKRYHFQPVFSDGHRGDRDLTFETLPEPQDLINAQTLSYGAGKVDLQVTLVTSLTAELHLEKTGDRDPMVLEAETASTDHHFEIPVGDSDETRVTLRFRELKDEIPLPTVLGPRLIAKRLTERFQESSESFQKLEGTLADQIRKTAQLAGGNAAGKTRDAEVTRLRTDFENYLDQGLGLPAESLLGTSAILLADDRVDCATQGSFHEKLDRLTALDRLAVDLLGTSFLKAPPGAGSFLQVTYPDLLAEGTRLVEENLVLIGGGPGPGPGSAASDSTPRSRAAKLAKTFGGEGGRLRVPLGESPALEAPFLYFVMKVSGLCRAHRLVLTSPSGVHWPVRIDREPPSTIDPDGSVPDGDLEKLVRKVVVKVPARCFEKPFLELSLEPEPLAPPTKAAVILLDLRLGS